MLCYVMLYNICYMIYVMLYNICYFTLWCAIQHVILCYVIIPMLNVMFYTICYMTYVMLYNIS